MFCLSGTWFLGDLDWYITELWHQECENPINHFGYRRKGTEKSSTNRGETAYILHLATLSIKGAAAVNFFHSALNNLPNLVKPPWVFLCWRHA